MKEHHVWMSDPLRPAALVEKKKKFVKPLQRVKGDFDG